jgi:hypothetical protein
MASKISKSPWKNWTLNMDTPCTFKLPSQIMQQLKRMPRSHIGTAKMVNVSTTVYTVTPTGHHDAWTHA